MLIDRTTRPDRSMAPRGVWPPFPWNPRGLDNPLIGRDEALTALTTAFEGVITDWTTRVQLLVSEYGMGKQRLMAQLVDQAIARQPETFVVRVRCPDTGGPYRLWDAIVRQAFEIPTDADDSEAGALLARAVEEILPSEAGDVATLLAYLVGYDLPGRPVLAVGADQEAMIARCVAALGRLLSAIAFERPLLIVVAHANGASARDFALTSALEASLKGRPIMMVFAGTPELTDHLPGWDRFPVTRLRALTADESRTMLDLYLSGLDGGPSEGLVDRIIKSSGGNAYGLKSMVRYIWEAGGIVGEGTTFRFDSDHAEQLTLPDNLEGVILERLGTLSAEERLVLSQAAVVGRDFWLGALVALHRQDVEPPEDLNDDVGPATIRDLLRRLVEHRFVETRTSQLRGEEAFSFRSDAHWRVALNIMPSTVRQRCHRLVGSWLYLQTQEDPSPHLSDLGRHAEGAGRPGDAATYYLKAARYQLQEHQSDHALRLLERAHSLIQPDQTATRLEILFELGDIHVYAGATSEAKDYFVEALEVAWRIRHRSYGARALIQLAEVAETFGDFDEAEDHYKRGLKLYEETQDQKGVASSCTALGKLHWLRGEFEQAIRCYSLSEHIHRRLRNDQGLGEVVHAVGAVHYDRGDVSLAEQYYARALELRRKSKDRRGLVRTLNNLGIVWLGRKLDRAVDVWEEALGIAREIGDLGLEATLADNLGEALVLLRRYTEAGEYLARAVELSEQMGRRRTLVDALRNQGLLLLAQGEWHAAERVLMRAQESAESLGLARWSALVARAMGDLAVAEMESNGVIAEEGGREVLHRAEQAYRSAAESFEVSGYDLEAAKSRERLAEMLELAGRQEEAMHARARATTLREARSDSPTQMPA